MDYSFTDTEKRFVLAEIIKVSQLDVNTLVDFVRSYNVDPDWLSMQLPGGRNMNQVIRAYEAMFQVHVQNPPLPAPNLKRKSLDDLNDHMPKRLALSPVEQPPPSMQAAQPQPPPSSALPFPRNVNIQPRPAPNGYPALASIAASPPIPHTAGPLRKRGRPSKADKEAQARANASSGYVPVAPMPAIASQPPIQTGPPPGPPRIPSPEQNPAAPPPPLPPPQPGQSPYQVALSPYGAPKGPGGRGRSPAAGAPMGSEEGSKSHHVRWRPITSPSDYPVVDKRGSRVVSDSAASRATPPDAKSGDRSERSPSLSNLISAHTPETDYSLTAMSAAATAAASSSRYSPTAAQAAAAGHRIYGSSGGGGQPKPAVDPLKHDNNGHNLNAQAPVSNPA